MYQCFSINDIPNRHLSIRSWRFCHIKFVIKLIKSLLPTLNHKEHKDGRVRYTKQKHKELFKLLNIISFFDYHQTNNGFIILRSQVVYYIYKGWREYRDGNFMVKGELDYHHLDHDCTNDSPSNLVKTTPYENKLLATCVKGGFYIGKVIKEKITCMAKFAALVKQTQIATLTRLAKESFVVFTNPYA
jgi:hypothetical protein